MYTDIRSVQILLSLMKKYGINNAVLSPGGSDIPIIHSIEQDDFFKCHSVVDERSAVYYAIGVSQETMGVCACVCTSGTAVCNYLPGATEAYYQNVPLLLITADKNSYFQGQLETQKIKQTGIFGDVIKYSIDLPVVKNKDDEWLCNRLVNEALIELYHHGCGPVHINIPIVEDTNAFHCVSLPDERKISVMPLDDSTFKKCSKYLQGKRVMVVVGQDMRFSSSDIQILNEFFDIYDCIFATEHLSNLNCKGTISYYKLTETHRMLEKDYLLPDVIISVGNNLSAYMLKPFLRFYYDKMENWLVWENGTVRDAYKCLTNIFECSPMLFFKKMIEDHSCSTNSHAFYEQWKSELEKTRLPVFEFSNFYVAQELAKIIPENSTLDTAILNSTRIMQFFELANNVRCYSNVGALGIDGCFSTFAGRASVTNGLAFLVIGDLSFFYDMNAAGISSIGANVRVILLNNGGGSEFHFFAGKKSIPTIDDHICAKHEKVATGWIKSLGYDYYFASNKDEFDAVIGKFGEASDRPMFLEVLTDMEEDADKANAFYDIYRKGSESISGNMKQFMKTVISEKKINKIKVIARILKE